MAVAALDQRHAFGRETLQFDRSHLRAVLLVLALRCACSLSSSSRSIRSMARWNRLTVDQSRSSRSGSSRVSLECRDQGVEDVGDGAGDGIGLRAAVSGRARPGRDGSRRAAVR